MSSTVATLKKIGLYVAFRVLCRTLELLSFLMSLLFSEKRSAVPVIDDHNLVTPAIKLSQQIKEGHITSEEVVESFIARIKRVNPIINAVVDDRFERALKEARDIDKKLSDARNNEGDTSILKLPLIGVPVSIKETISVEDQSYTGGLLTRKLVKAPKTADAVGLLMKNGLIPIASTNVPELAMWWDCSNPVYGQTNNPYDLARIPGGSSGGEAALISSAGSVIGVGNDIAGSIRMPCNFCGIFGHKPTPFVVSNVGSYPSCKGDREKLLGMGPIVRYACDMIPMLKIMAGAKAEKLKLDQHVDLSKIRMFYIEELGDPLASACNPDILEGLHAALSHFVKKHRTPVEKVTLEEFRHGMFLWSAEANKDCVNPTLGQQFEDGSGELNPIIEVVKKSLNCSNHNMTSIAATALDKLGPDTDSSSNRILNARADELRQKFNDLVGDDGVLLVPTHPEPAPKHYTTLLKIFNVSYTSVTTVLLGPITQCPLGMSKEGLPFGVQVIAKPFNDRLTLAVAVELEKACGGWTAPCRIDL